MTGKDKAKEIYKNLSPGNKNVFINMEAIEALPEEFDVIITDVKFDPKRLENSFTNVGTNNNPAWYPKTELVYDIAEARGILGYGEKTIETITEEVDINPMLCKPLDAEPAMRIMPVAVRVTKKSKVLCEDGTFRPSSPCTNEFNYWDRANLDWLNDEKYNNGKYKTPLLRKLRYMELKKFAIQQAETKAFVKTVRELAGLPTGFKTEDLQGGKLTFFKIVRSKTIIKLETAARIDAIRKGNTAQIESDIREVFEAPQIEAPTEIKDISDGGKDAPNTEFELEPEIIDEPTREVTNTKPEPFKKDFHDMEYQERLVYLKQIQFAEWDELHKKQYLRDVLKAYIDQRGPNRAILGKLAGAIQSAEHRIVKFNDVKIDDMLKFIKKIEDQKNIIKLETTLP